MITSRTERQLLWAMHAGFFALVLSSCLRLSARHGLTGKEGQLALAGLMAVIYAAGVVFWERLGRRRDAWLMAVLACWLVLVVLAPSFAWCAIPLGFVSMRVLSPRRTIAVVVLLTATVIAARYRLESRDGFDPSMILGPLTVAGMTTMIFFALQRLIDELTRTRDELATAQRAAGVLEERERLAREIHDTLAQGFTSMGMLLQAAGRAWDADPAAARAYVEQAEGVGTAGLEEARRFVRGLAPLDLDSGSLAEGLRSLVARDPAGIGLRTEGTEFPLDPETQGALLRVAQGALSNAREHAGASRIMVTLSFLDDAVTLDIADDGRGFAEVAPDAGRGYGLRSMRDRLEAVGGTLVVESAPGQGTVVAATVGRTG
ncbi:sensor histidine kinase [Actinocorallia longicatena]|uniref:Oxygen sensor histidine kinase NreB n=1 Tax=Actinocorallia longicatena TaxID=111803 RepID=A0ABP6QGG7_9ACTN